MVERQQEQPIVLRNDVPGDARKVRAILADWGLAEEKINFVLNVEAPQRPNTRRDFAQHPSPIERPRPTVRPA
jgi:hypothetical protein